MPPAFPSHQGLIAPLWRAYPGRFDVLALCIGAASPDIVDGIAGACRGGLGQWYGHTLAGLFVFCIPVGLILTIAGYWLAEILQGTNRWERAGWWLEGLKPSDGHGRPAWSWGCAVLSLGIGTFSHLLVDFISHGNFMWFYPWYEDPNFFPSWWYKKWFEIPLPGYKHPYPAGPHLLVWTILGLLGIIMFFWPLMRRRSSK